jgi:hypothetical protein
MGFSTKGRNQAYFDMLKAEVIRRHKVFGLEDSVP